MSSASIIIKIPEFIERIASSSDRELAWKFFILFSRFEYALKRNSHYLIKNKVVAEPNWDKFGSEQKDAFCARLSSSPDLLRALEYFLSQPPRKQLVENSVMVWSEPQFHNGKDPVFTWLLLMIRHVRNNLFHGGKFPLVPIADPSRDRDLMIHAINVLSLALDFDKRVRLCFEEDFNDRQS